MLAHVKTNCPECGTEYRIQVNFPHDNAGFEPVTFKCTHCKQLLNMVDDHLYCGSTTTKERSEDECKWCGDPLDKSETLWAAEGSLYCSRTCGIAHVKRTIIESASEMAVEIFNDNAEEIATSDILDRPTCPVCGEVIIDSEASNLRDVQYCSVHCGIIDLLGGNHK